MCCFHEDDGTTLVEAGPLTEFGGHHEPTPIAHRG